MYDLAQEPTKQMMKMEGIVCPRCKAQNGPSARFCMNCSLVLDDELAMQLKQDETMRESVAQSLVTGEISHEDIREIIREEVRRALGLPVGSVEPEPEAPL
jgi:ribosomal protein L40E